MKRIAVLLCVLILLTLSGCFFLPAEEEPATLSVLNTDNQETYKFSYVTRGDLEQWVSINCKFQSLQQEHLRFAYDGREVGEVHVEIGDLVEPGQVLAELKNDVLDGKLEAAQNTLHQLSSELAYARHNLEIVSESAQMTAQAEKYEDTVARLEGDYAIALMRVEELQEQKRHESIIAGIEGVVTYIRNYNKSDTQNDSIVISARGAACFYADTEYYDNIPAGMEVTLTTDEGEITAVATDAEELGFAKPEVTAKGTSRVYFVPTTELTAVSSSTRAKLNLLIDSRYDVLIVQSRAVFFAGGQAYAYYENENGVREAKQVELGLKVSNKYEVLSGLTEGETLVVG